MKSSTIWNKLDMSQKIKTLEAEIAKAKNELACLQGDADKINGRLRFVLSGIHNINEDLEINQDEIN